MYVDESKLKRLRMAIIVPKKVAPKATQRNQIKRQALGILEPYIRDNQSGLDLVVYFHRLTSTWQKDIVAQLQAVLAEYT